MTETLRLTPEEESMLVGESGAGVQKAMEIVVALGQIYGAADLVEVHSVQVSGVSYKNLGEAGLGFLTEWAEKGASARVPATLNPAGMDLDAWQQLGFSLAFAQRQQAVISAYVALGINPACTCTPYLVGHVPGFGEHVAWAESSAVSYANSVLGARTNREGGPSALAAAIVGRTARYGLHLEENRRATHTVHVECSVASEADLGALGFLVGREIGHGIPLFHFKDLEPLRPRLKTLGAAMAASGAVALYHVDGLTPEAGSAGGQNSAAHTISVDDLSPGYRALNGSVDLLDLVSIGCPHASLSELEAIASYLDGRRVATNLWITTARDTLQTARQSSSSVVDRIEAAGGRVVADTCMVVAPVQDLGFRSMATNSAKMAYYAPAHSGMVVRFGPLAQCLEAAIRGSWNS